MKLSGLLFLHRISDNRWSGAPNRNLVMFQELCGNDALKNVILTTTMWDLVDEQTGSRRETELREKYWKIMISAEARMARFHRTYDSAWDIIDQFSGDRRVLQIQREMVDERKRLMDTAAGSTLFSFLENIIAQLKKLLRDLEKRLRRNRQNDDPSNRTMAATMSETRIRLERMEGQANILAPTHRPSSPLDRRSRNPSPTPSQLRVTPPGPILPTASDKPSSWSPTVGSIRNRWSRASPRSSRLSATPVSNSTQLPPEHSSDRAS
jgi:hypothetical protein